MSLWMIEEISSESNNQESETTYIATRGDGDNREEVEVVIEASTAPRWQGEVDDDDQAAILTAISQLDEYVLVYHDDPLTDPGCFPPVDELEIDCATAEDIDAACEADPDFSDWLDAHSVDGERDNGLDDICYVGVVSKYDYLRHEFRCSSIDL